MRDSLRLIIVTLLIALVAILLEAAVILCGWMLYRRSLAPERRYAEPVYTLLAALLVIQAVADIVLIFAEGLRKC